LPQVSERQFTDAQNAAIYAIDRSMAVVAGAGSGKTTVLIDRCRHIIGDDWTELDRLLAITFTEKAAGELKGRLRPLMPPRQRHRLEGAWIGTFHASCARMLRQHAPLVGLDPSFAIMDENASGLASRQAVRLALLELLDEKDPHASFLVDAMDFRAAAGALEELMDFRWHARRALARPESEEPEETKILKALAHVYVRAEEKLLSQFGRTGALDFQELEIRAIDLLDGHPDVLKSYRRRFRHLLIDEFQDTNDAQTELVLKLFHPERNRLCIVGDPRQSIYRFRGANIDCFATALERIRNYGGETVHLAENFRSRHGIVEFVNLCQEGLADGLFGRLASDGITSSSEGMIAARDDGKGGTAVSVLEVNSPPEAKASERREAEAMAIANLITELVKKKKAKWGDVVCLFQALTGVAAYEIAFKRAGIPYRFFGGRGLLTRQEVLDLLAALSFAQDPADQVSLLGLLRSPLIGLTDDELVKMAGPDGDGLMAAARNDPRCWLLDELIQMAEHLRPSEILRRILDMTGFELLCHRLDPSGGMTANIDRFMALAESIERQEPTPLAEFAGFVRDLKEQSARLGDPPAVGDAQATVRCMTVHAAKGLEFPVVILPDLFRSPHTVGGNWQFSRKEGIGVKLKDPLHPFGPRRETERYLRLRDVERDGEEAESKRLLYVAMTRARDLLVLPIHPGIKRDGPWHRWLTPVIEKTKSSENLVQWKAGDDSPPRRNEEHAVKGERREMKYEVGSTKYERRTNTFTVSQLECYDRCPQEYYLKYILGLPANEIFKEGGDKLPANIFGSIVHGILAHLEPIKRIGLKDLIETECLANGVFPDTKTVRAVRKAIDQACALPILAELNDGWREVRFDWRTDGSVISGSIDWLKPTTHGLEVVDFKTDAVDRPGVKGSAKEYDLQLISYALAAEAATTKRVGATTLVFLAPGVVHRTEMTDERRAKGWQRIAEIIEAIGREAFAIGDKKLPCFKCPYHHNGMCWEDKLARS
jgi:ATP-dependent helicase/nuclease subunit A